VTLPPDVGQGGQVQIQLVSGDVDALRAGGPVELQIGMQ
jgi:hypothetical protein